MYYPIEEGDVFIDDILVKSKCFNLNVDKVVAFYVFDGDEGTNSNIRIITDNHNIIIKGYGRTEKEKGLGEYIEKTLQEYLDNPQAVCFGEDKVRDEKIPTIEITGEIDCNANTWEQN